nr:MAG TPA: hypothetical protein [Crassvirales sp.]
MGTEITIRVKGQFIINYVLVNQENRGDRYSFGRCDVISHSQYPKISFFGIYHNIINI